MDSRDFCYWLQGYIELNGMSGLTGMQTDIIKDHLKKVFDKQTPDRQITYPPIFEPSQIKPLKHIETPFIC